MRDVGQDFLVYWVYWFYVVIVNISDLLTELVEGILASFSY